MKHSVFKLLILLQFVFMLVEAGYRPSGAAKIRLKDTEILKPNPYLYGISKQVHGSEKEISNLQVLKDITAYDNLTISYEVFSRKKLKGSGKNVPFCMDNTSVSQDGSMVKILRMAFGLQPEGCPIKQGPREAPKHQEIHVWGLEVPVKLLIRHLKMIIKLTAPGYGEIAQVVASY